MPARKLRQRVRHTRQQFNLLFGNRVRKSANAFLFLFGNRGWAQPLKAGHHRMRKTRQAVPARKNRLALHGVQRLPHLGRRVFMMIQIADERRNRPLKVDVVFPERVVGINQQGLAGREVRHVSMVKPRRPLSLAEKAPAASNAQLSPDRPGNRLRMMPHRILALGLNHHARKRLSPAVTNHHAA